MSKTNPYVDILIRNEPNGKYALVMQSKQREMVLGVFDDYSDALRAEKKAMALIKADDNIIKHSKAKIHTPAKREIQRMVLALSDDAAVDFYENIIMLNSLTHLLTEAFDNLCPYFGQILDVSVKTHYRNAEKQITALLDAVYGSMFEKMDADGAYLNLVKRSTDFSKFLRLMLCYIKADDWRNNELCKTFSNIAPQEWIDSIRDFVKADIRQKIGVNNRMTDISE